MNFMSHARLSFPVIKPISSVAHLKLNTKPEEQEFKIPKVSLTIIFDDISIGLAKLQVKSFIETLHLLIAQHYLTLFQTSHGFYVFAVEIF